MVLKKEWGILRGDDCASLPSDDTWQPEDIFGRPNGNGAHYGI